MKNQIEAQQHVDILQFEILKSINCDFTKEHNIDFLFLGDSEFLSRVEESLLRNGFIKHPKQERKNGLLLTKKMILDIASMQNTTKELVNLAQINGVTYDGWGCVARNK